MNEIENIADDASKSVVDGVVDHVVFADFVLFLLAPHLLQDCGIVNVAIYLIIMLFEVHQAVAP